ncbi:polymorphic toxin-type HINT domain-containing protein [Streptomyces sp. 11x1]|uniref:polymorphic toxin-type HINT domain-containing protein n=1 Tax=Streptomyces sp. 11x1 TaxID=3038642 RepID=UPI00292FB8AB|nr:polymorphic toxin-type HINT domain-containing protein [Streptomyces sp. 11x1]WNZ10883.1 polymorphic toxin-type HINT domain-containing protein [Streptomyces sp. 11x1]
MISTEAVWDRSLAWRAYDAADHVTKVTYPAAGGLAAETVTTTYDTYGRPDRLTSTLGTAVYIDDTAYDSYDRLTGRTYGADFDGNGINAQRTYSYDDSNGTRRLTSIATTTNVNELITEKQKDTYTYDLAGRITELREEATGQTAQSQCFRYDDQSRLTRAFTHTTAGICANTAQTTTNNQGTAPYQTAYTYDRMGNLQSVTDTDSAGTAALRDYLYPGYDDAGTWTTANANWPHGVRKILHKTGSTTTRTDTVTYDDDGTMLKRIEQPATGTATTVEYTWTKLAQLATVKTTKASGSELTRYAYDADGNLLVRTTPSETIASLAGTELRTDGTNVTATRHYTSGTATVAMRTTEGTTATNGKLTYLMGDTQASTQIAVDATTGTSTRRRYTPFGDERSGTLPTGTDNGFLGKTEDTSTGLSLLGARAYDPNLGRFLSPDPLSSPYKPQNLSSYSYSYNNPVNLMDPTGLENCYPFDCAGEVTDFDEPKPPTDPPVVTDLGDGTAPSAPTDLVNNYLGDDQDAPTVGQMQAAGTYMPHVSPELNYELYFRERCGRDGMGTDMTCANFRKHYDNWAHVKSIDADSCPICGNIGFLAIVEYALGRGGKLGRPCPPNSFLPEAGVRMADGSVKEIGDIEVGDKVLATDPETGKTEARTVLATIITMEDKDFTGLTVKTSDGDAEIIATDHHPFWSPSADTWIDAGDIEQGMTLRTDTGTTVTVNAVRSFQDQAETRNLTVDGIHTYYVLAGATPILVHNITQVELVVSARVITKVR